MSWRSRVLERARIAGRFALGRMPANRRQQAVVELVRAAGAVSTPEERGRLYRAISSQTVMWPTLQAADELHSAGLYAAVWATADVPGAIVECGVAQGRSLVALARAASIFAPGKPVLGFDSFEGFPVSDAADVGPRVDAAGIKPTGFTDTSVALVQEMLDAPAELIEGYFSYTLPSHTPDKISLLHVDCDMYQSTADVLRYCVPQLSSGAMVIFDEYHEERWPGATKAIDEVFDASSIEWAPELGRFVIRTI